MVVIFSGAGLSAESGIQTFRDSDGLWNNHRIEDVCMESTWKKNFDLVHKFYNERRIQLVTVEPNLAHVAIAEFSKNNECINLTQNVDNMLEQAGCTDVIHLHGFLTEMACTACGKIWDIGCTEWEQAQCCTCGSVKGVRPNIVFFGGQAPMYSKMYKILNNLTADDTLIVVGTMGNVVPVAQF